MRSELRENIIVHAEAKAKLILMIIKKNVPLQAAENEKA